MSGFFRKLGLDLKLNLILVAGTGLTLLIAIVLLSQGLSNLALQVGRQRLEEEVGVIDGQFARAEQATLETARLMAATSGLNEAVAAHDATRVRMLAPVRAYELGLDALDIVDGSGERLAALPAAGLSGVEGNSQLLALGLQGIESTGVIATTGDGQRLLLTATVPLHDESRKVVGALMVSREIDDEFLGEMNFFRDDIHLAVVREGEIVQEYAHQDPVDSQSVDAPAGSREDQERAGPVNLAGVALEETALEEALGGQTVISGDFAFSSDGVPYLQAYTPLPTAQATSEAVVVIQVNLERQLLFKRQLTAALILALLVPGLLSIGAMAMFAWRSVVAPLSELQAATERLAEGDYSQQATVAAQDEIGRLAEAFNKMASIIQERETALQSLADELGEQANVLAEANQQLSVARAQAEEANRLKSQFLATMSHELRTPLNAIIGYTEIILVGMAGELTSEQQGYYERVLANGQHLLDLISEVLDLSKIEAGRMEIIRRPLDIHDWLNEVAFQMKGMAEEKGLVFEMAIDDEMPKIIIGDYDRLKQIAINLLSNAIKFTNGGTVKVDVRKQAMDAWTLEVSDTGIGIPPHAQEFIFDEFRQIDGTSQRKYGGTGLGLAIVRNLTLLMGGNVRVKSKVGEGSTFTVHLPLITEDGVSSGLERAEITYQ